MSKWEDVPGSGHVRRFSVPSGWIYHIHGEIVFVPEPAQEVTIVLEDILPGGVDPRTGLTAYGHKGHTAPPVRYPVVVGGKVLSDLVGAVSRLLRAVGHHDDNGILLHECDVAQVALDEAIKAFVPDGDEKAGVDADTDNLAQLVALKALAFKLFFESKYYGEPIQCHHIRDLFTAVAEWTAARNEYAKPQDLSEAPIG